MVKRDYYLILGVSRREDIAGIKEAFRKLVKKYHPDLGGSYSRWEFQDIVEAYEMLSDPQKKKSYDEGLAHGEGDHREQSQTIVTNPPRYAEPLVPEPVSVMRDFLSISQPIDALFERIFRNFTTAGITKAERPEGLTLELILSPSEAFSGGRVPISIPVLYPCQACRGSGRVWPYVCSNCGGRGMVEEDETVVLNVPARVKSGTIYEIPLRGLGIHNFYLRVQVRIGGFS
ncbi:MAG: DnaJ domain-containing protein [Desulfomonilia bacterium]|nr:DnaJ domain-containing protein [Desulfomonilia bacterium]